MKKLFIILLLLSSMTSFSQEIKKKLRSRFSFGVYFTPSFSYRTLYCNDDYTQWMADERENHEGKSPAWNLGLFSECDLGKRFSLDFGLQYSYYSFITDPIAFSSADNPDANQLRISYNYNYASLPISIRYNIIQKKKWELFVSAGVASNLFVSYNQKHFFYTDDKKTATEVRIHSFDHNSFTLSATGGIGVNYKINQRIMIGLNPVFDHAFISSTDSDIKEYLYSLGVGIRLSFFPFPN